MVQKKTKQLLFHIFQIIISIGLISFIIYKANPQTLLQTIKGIEIQYYFYFLILVFISTLMLVFRWYILARASLGNSVNGFKLIKFTLIGFFFNLFMPTAVGGDIIKGYLLGKSSGKMENGSMTVLVDRFIGILTIFSIGFVSAIFAFNSVADKRITIIVLVLFITLLAGMFIFLNRGVMKYFSKLFDIFKLKKLKAIIKEFYESIYLFKDKKLQVFYAFFTSILMQMINIFAIFVLSKALGMTVSYFYFLIFIPLIYVIQMIPISISGIGVRENSFVFFFGLVGVPKEIALTLSLLYFSIFLIIGIIGAIVMIFSKINYKNIEGYNE
ncbi:flippase-like domain-containing protein [Candidatus Dependentiae bacterium]|nr:flippase-like domain-containing protein [Candidatus Dependentiae bacterium]